ncbi:MAG: hypothetical protein JXB49_37125, partial [Bacteroidales bacterium]|nr:hypothetical protein [Bacteroidales bacterium]
TLNNYMYTGEQYDPNVGFYYLRFRYYNPTNGRFLTMDTWPGMQFEPMSLHKYLYCESGPVGRWDPSGKIPTLLGQVIKMTIIGALIGGVSYITGFLLGKALGSDKEFSVKELLLSIGIGAIANGLGAYIHAGFAVSVGGIQLVAHLSVLFNMIQNGILSAYYYCQINKNSNEGISANGFFVSTALGVLAAGFAGPGGSTFIRGATSNLSAQTLESLVAGFREFIKTVKDTDYQFLMEEFIRKYESQYLRYGPLRLRR